MFCEDCGNQVVEGDHFCRACGQTLGAPSASEPVAILSMEELGHPAEESKAEASTSLVDLTIPMTYTVSEGTPGSTHLPFSGSTSSKDAKTKETYPGSVHSRRSLVLMAAVGALILLGLLGIVWNTRTSGAPPADPAQALQHLKDVAKIDMPIDDAAVDSSNYQVPASIPQEPSPASEYIGSVSMGSGDTIELRVAAYALAADAAHYAFWWNTSGAKEYFAETSDVSVAVQCGRIVIDGAWVHRHTQSDTIKLLHDAYPDCTPYIPEQATPATPAPATPAPATPAPATPAPADGLRAGNGIPVSGAFAITNLVVTDKGQGNLSVSFTVKNTTGQVLTLRPIVDASSVSGWAEFHGEALCHSLHPNESERITIAGGSGYGAVPTTWTEAVVKNFDIC